MVIIDKKNYILDHYKINSEITTNDIVMIFINVEWFKKLKFKYGDRATHDFNKLEL